ncbi:hypothetical protein [Ornithinimicrobium panacihumi]|uniref:hypothetical protein n=1 Tax=Ornithinimicrobium panacihumi TaxID=2008449 RepID=UPI003F89DAAC
MEDFGPDSDPTEVLRHVVDELYAVEPSGFIAARKEWVARLRSTGLLEVAKEAGALRRPSVAAAAVNALVRSGAPVVGRLRDVGSRMRHAQSALDAVGLSALRGERDELLKDWVAAAREHSPGGADLAAGTEAEVRDTAIAALADPEATEVVTSGSLTRALAYSGFGEVDVADAVARTSTGVVLTRIQGGADDDVPEAEEPEPDVEPDKPDEDEPEEPEEPEENEPAEVPEEEAEGSPDEELLARLAMELDETEKQVAAARASRKDAADAAAKADRAVKTAAEQVAQAERLLEGARAALEKATAAQGRAATTLEEADEELRLGRRARDAARAALEEAEDG